MSGINLTDLGEGTTITLKVSNKVRSIEMHAALAKILREDLAVITIDYQSKQVLNFDGVRIEMESQTEDGMPYKWSNVKVAFYQKQYILQTEGEGNRINRREFFRVGVSKRGLMRMAGRGQRILLCVISV